MSLSALIREHRPVVVAGRCFIVRAPTLATMQRLSERFADVLHACHAGWQAAGDGRRFLTAEAFLPLFLTRPDDVAVVLTTCVDTDEPVDRWPLREIILAVLRLSDPARLAAGLALGEAASGRTDRQLESIVAMAKRFHCAPFDILEWPYEGFLAVCDAEAALVQEELLRKQGCSDEYIDAMRGMVN